MAQLRKLPTYHYGGGVSSDTSGAINLVPYNMFPRNDRERISHRMMLREEVLYDKIKGRQ